MALAGLGNAPRENPLSRVLRLEPGGRFRLGLRFFRHPIHGFRMSWDGCGPEIAPLYTASLNRLLGRPRRPYEPLAQSHIRIAAATQARYEEALYQYLSHIHRMSGEKRLCLAGGCALNSAANGGISARTPFEDTYIQPAAGDAGGALGAALHVWHQVLGRTRGFVMERADWGPEFSANEIESALGTVQPELDQTGCTVERLPDESSLCRAVAGALSQGKVVGWFQGRMEWGPRALGNRSILADPRSARMKDRLNARVKGRESFRPFAPAILREHFSEWFDALRPNPFMVFVQRVRREKAAGIPAVLHVDGTARVQAVDREQSPLFWRLIETFRRRTGVPLVLNTSFNENEPIVCTPEQALACFLRTGMDVLAMGPFVISRGPCGS
jgi:carbamoyltransferase